MKLSRTVDYALKATLLLAQSETAQPVPCSHLAKQGQMPERFLLQILRSLVTHGILRSTRGVDGGYTLVRRPEDVSVLEIIEAIDGPIEEAAPPDEASEPAETTFTPEARLQAALKDVSHMLREQLNAIKISQLLPPPPHLN